MVNGVVTPKSQSDGDVVDEARFADGGGRDQPHRTAGFVERLQRQRIDEREIIDAREACGSEPLLRSR